MLDLIFRLALTAALGYAAYVDWRTMRVPFPLMWSILIVGVVVAAFERQWTVVIVAVAAAVISSLAFLAVVYLRIALIIGIGFSVWLATDQTDAVTATVIAICFVWLLFEFNLVGGADATIAIGLLAMFHSAAFVALLAITTLGGSLLMLIARHRLGAGRVLLGAAVNLWKMKPLTVYDYDLEQNGMPAAWKIALAGVLFAWMPTFLRLYP